VIMNMRLDGWEEGGRGDESVRVVFMNVVKLICEIVSALSLRTALCAEGESTLLARLAPVEVLLSWAVDPWDLAI